MAESTEDLRLALSKLRADLGGRTAAREAAVDEPVSAAKAVFLDAPVRSPEPPAKPLRPAEPPGPGRSWGGPVKAVGLALAAAGAFLHADAILGTGLLVLLAEAVAAAAAPAAGSAEAKDVLLRLDALERRASSPEISGAPREIQEELRELRSMVKSFYSVLEAPPKSNPDKGEDSF